MNDDVYMADLEEKRPSLDRLKALDSLPDLSSQLAEAGLLCNHAHRAEMIMKWLSNKLSTPTDVRTDGRVWDLLARCFRLVQPVRVPALLGHFDLLSSATDALTACHPAGLKRLMLKVDGVLATMLEISQSSAGLAIKRLFRVDTPKAAGFVGSWSRNLLRLPNNLDVSFSIRDVVEHDLLNVPIQVWEWRKRTQDETRSFSTECFVLAAELLVKLSNEESVPKGVKRKRNESGDQTRLLHYRRFLEGMFAREIFLPARTAFFEAEDSSRLRSLLQPLKHVISRDDDQRSSDAAAIPLLLNIALRCVPTPTPRQRQKERPWVDAIFAALLDCMQPAYVDIDVLVDMLSVIGQRSTLPTETLEALVREYSALNPDVDEEPKWKLVAKVAELDARVFVHEGVAQLLFDGLSAKALTDSGDSLKHAEVRRLCTDGKIIDPVMEAFAKKRDLVGFIEQWHEQLVMYPWQLRAQWSPWTELDGPLAELLESYLTGDQTSRLVDRFHGDITTMLQISDTLSNEIKLGTLESKPEFCRLQASIVLLNAVAQGVRSDDLQDALQPKLEACFNDMMTAFEIGPWALKLHSSVWTLITRLFKLWFPSWLAKQDNREAAESRAYAIMKRPALEFALRLSETIRRPSAKIEVLESDIKATSRAEHFLAHLCSSVYSYDKCINVCRRYMQTIAFNSHQPVPFAFVTYPATLALLSSETTKRLVLSAFEHAEAVSKPDGICSDCSGTLKAIVEIARERSNHYLVEPVIDAAVECLNLVGVSGSIIQKQLAIEVLTHFPSMSLPRPQRERILNALCEVDYDALSVEDESHKWSCLSLIIHLMGVPNSTSDLCAKAAVLWRLSSLINAPYRRKVSNPIDIQDCVKYSKTLALLEEIVRLVMTQLLATQDQARSLQLLSEHSAQVNIAMRNSSGSKIHVAQHLGTLNTIRVVLVTLHSGLTKSNMQQVNKHAEALQPFSEKVIKEAMQIAASRTASRVDAALNSTALVALLDVGLVVTNVIINEADASGKSVSDSLVDVATTVLDNHCAHDAAPTKSAVKDTTPADNAEAIQAYEILCKLHCMGSPERQVLASKTTQYASEILGRELQPDQRVKLISCFADAIRELHPVQKVLVVHDLARKVEVTSTSSISLLKAAIAVIIADDVRAELHNIRSPISHLLTLLEMNKDFATHAQAVDCVLSILQHKNYLVNQHTTEATLAALQHLAQDDTSAGSIKYLDACQIITLLLTHQRHRLKGRLHLVIAALQVLLARLFHPTRPATVQAEISKHLTVRHARAFARVLTLFCNPSQLRKSSGTDLVDQTRKNRAHIGQHVQYLLHHYCAQVLNGALGEGMREALTPGLWAMVEAIEVNSADGIKALSAAMNNSERAVLRGVYNDWKRFGKWQGG